MTALFRAIGALFSTFDGASKVSGFLISALIMYTGYMIQKPQMHPWFEWIFWIDPLAYGFEALLSNEFHGKIIPCIGNNLIPQGPGYNDSAHQSCAGVGGAIQGNTYVTGEQYLGSLSYSHSHLWRNFGINWAWWVLFVVVTIVATSRWKSPSESGSCLVIPRERLEQHNQHAPVDEESQVQEKSKKPSEGDARDENNIDSQLVRNTSVFTWKNLSYTVKTPTGDRLLLDNVYGWVKPGMLGALMGSSGAGKTTLVYSKPSILLVNPLLTACSSMFWPRERQRVPSRDRSWLTAVLCLFPSSAPPVTVSSLTSSNLSPLSASHSNSPPFCVNPGMCLARKS